MRKYRNKPLVVDGERFDSQREYQRWLELKLMERAGVISNLRRQVRLPLGVKSSNGRERVLVVDFAYMDHGEQRYEDVKGSRDIETPVSKLKRDILRARGIEVEIRT